MRLRYDEDLLEAAVFRCAHGRRPGVPSLQVSRFHCERERLYGLLDPDERQAAFFQLHWRWFREWGLERGLTDVLRDFPLLFESLGTLAIRQARGKHDEGAELYVNDTGQRTGVVALRPERLDGDAAAVRFLRHELTHLHDMVNPAFGYSPELRLPGWNTPRQRLVQERYRLLWDITIDGRLRAAGHLPPTARDLHWAAFARAHSFWSESQQAHTFARLWQNPSPRHDELLALATDPRGLRDTHHPMPGAACPLCGFPTFDWQDAAQLSSEVAAAIQVEFPQWQSPQGLCSRCHEIYRMGHSGNLVAKP
jgi:hypothetical protein